MFPKWSLAITCIALTLTLALGVDWAAAEWFSVGSPTARWWLLTGTLALLASSLGFLWGRQRSLSSQYIQDIELLGRSGSHQISAANRPNGAARPADEWNRAIGRVHEQMSAMARRIDELERDRSAYEHRAKSFEAQSRQVRSVLSALGEPVLVIDKQDDLVLTNSSANRVLSIQSDPSQQRALNNLVHCEQLVELLTETRKRKTFTQQCCEIELSDAAGEARWYRVTARNIPTQPGDSDPDGTSQGAVALLHDISSQRVLQRRNAEFVTAVSHEMKTPLAGIKAYVELLADGDAEDAASRAEFLRIVNTEAERLQYLVDDLVELARIEADLAGEKRNVQSLIPLVEEAIDEVRPFASQRSIQLTTEWDGDDVCALVDRPLLLQAVSHLLTNAVKYTPPAGKVTVRAYRTAADAVIEVADTGVGIASEEQEKIFDKFYRVAKDKSMAAGTGLGLPLVRHIVEGVHGGRVDLQSTPGEGSVFRILLAQSRSDSR